MIYGHLSAKEIERKARQVRVGGWEISTADPLATLLGSCIAVCLYDPVSRIGGMNHFMLPILPRSAHSEIDALLAGDYNMEALLNALLGRGARKQRMVAKAFGGGSTADNALNGFSIGERNSEFTRNWLEREKIPLLAADFAGPWARKVLFVPETGDAYCRRVTTVKAGSRLVAEEVAYARSLVKPATPARAEDKKIELF